MSKRLIILLTLTAALSMTACSKDASNVPTEDTQYVSTPDVIDGLTLSMRGGAILSVPDGSGISVDSNEQQATVYVNMDAESYYTVNVLLHGTNDLLLPYEKQYGVRRVKDGKWSIVAGDSETIAVKKINEDYCCLITTTLDVETLSSSFPEFM